MASKTFLVDLDLNLNKAKSFLFEDLGNDPSGTESRVYYNSTSKRLKVHNGTAYKTIAYTDDVPAVRRRRRVPTPLLGAQPRRLALRAPDTAQ